MEKHTPAKPSGVLHFYPGPKRIIYVVKGKPVLSGEAWGGEEPKPGENYGKMRPRPTTAGRYIVHSYGPYRTATWELAKIRWGTELRFDGKVVNGHYVGSLFVRNGSRRHPWRNLEDVAPKLNADFVADLFNRLYGESKRHKRPDERYLYDANHDGLPDRWLLNEFGPMAVRYFRDRNHNGVLDADERLSGEMIHTTPVNEAQVKRGFPIAFDASHGCVHISPVDRDALRDAGAFRRGTPFIVHKYSEPVPAALAKAPASP